MKNSPSESSDLKKTHVVYKYNCKLGDCELLQNSNYIGQTITTFSRRLTMHLQAGAPLKHTKDVHNQELTRKMLIENTKIIHKINDYHRLVITEALLISEENPLLNRQDTGNIKTLQLFQNM